MKSCELLCGVAIGMLAGAGAILLLPTRRTVGMKHQMKHTVQEIEGVMADAMDGIHAILSD